MPKKCLGSSVVIKASDYVNHRLAILLLIHFPEVNCIAKPICKWSPDIFIPTFTSLG